MEPMGKGSPSCNPKPQNPRPQLGSIYGLLEGLRAFGNKDPTGFPSEMTEITKGVTGLRV